MKFTLAEIMDALSDAFQKSGSSTSRDCIVRKNLRDILSARSGIVGMPTTSKLLLAERED